MEFCTRQIALAEKASRYFTGKSCKHGHVAERFVSSKRCVVCSYAQRDNLRNANPEKTAATSHRWVLKNRERMRAVRNAWNKLHPEAQAERARRWYLANKAKADTQAKAWKKRNPGKVNAIFAKLRADRVRQTPAWADLKAIDQIYVEARARRDQGENVEVDHVIPLRGRRVAGFHVHTNLQIIPMVSNRQKANHFHV